MALPTRKDVQCVAGDTWVFNINYSVDDTPIDIAGWSFRMMAREYLGSDETVIDEESVIPDDEPIYTYNIIIPASDTEELVNDTKDSLTFVYDIEITNPDETLVMTIVSGEITSYKGVTR